MLVYLAGALGGFLALGLEAFVLGLPAVGFFSNAGYVQVYLMVYSAPLGVGLLVTLISEWIRPWLLMAAAAPAALLAFGLTLSAAPDAVHFIPLALLFAGAGKAFRGVFH